MNEQIKTLMDEELVRELEKLKTKDPGSQEYLEALSAIERLNEMALNNEKVDLEFTEKRELRIFNNGRADEELRLKEAEEERLREDSRRQKREFWVKLGTDIGIAAASMAFFGAQWILGYTFEKNGTYTSTTFKEMRQKAFNILLRKKS